MTQDTDLQNVPKSGTEELVACPACGSNDNEIYNKDFDNPMMWAKVRCFDCDTKWQELYSLTLWELTEYKGEEISIEHRT